jgi:hypothetical protein
LPWQLIPSTGSPTSKTQATTLMQINHFTNSTTGVALCNPSTGSPTSKTQATTLMQINHFTNSTTGVALCNELLT